MKKRLNWNAQSPASSWLLNNAAARGIKKKSPPQKNVPLIKALKMMMEPSGGLNHGAGRMLIGAAKHTRLLTCHNNRKASPGLKLAVFACTSGVVFFFLLLFPRVLDERQQCDTPVSACCCALLFIFRAPAMSRGQTEVPKDFGEKDIARTPSMFPQCIHHCAADSWHTTSLAARLAAMCTRHWTAGAFGRSPTMLMRGAGVTGV